MLKTPPFYDISPDPPPELQTYLSIWQLDITGFIKHTPQPECIFFLLNRPSFCSQWHHRFSCSKAAWILLRHIYLATRWYNLSDSFISTFLIQTTITSHLDSFQQFLLTPYTPYNSFFTPQPKRFQNCKSVKHLKIQWLLVTVCFYLEDHSCSYPAYLYSWIVPPSYFTHQPHWVFLSSWNLPLFLLQVLICAKLTLPVTPPPFSLSFMFFRTQPESLYWRRLNWVLSTHPFTSTALYFPSSHHMLLLSGCIGRNKICCSWLPSRKTCLPGAYHG